MEYHSFALEESPVCHGSVVVGHISDEGRAESLQDFATAIGLVRVGRLCGKKSCATMG